jgi:hypothetical protein
LLDKEVVTLYLGGSNWVAAVSLLFFLYFVLRYLKFFTLKLKIVCGSKSGFSTSVFLKLNVSKTSAILAIRIGLEFCGNNVSVGLEQIKNLLLGGV